MSPWPTKNNKINQQTTHLQSTQHLFFFAEQKVVLLFHLFMQLKVFWVYFFRLFSNLTHVQWGQWEISKKMLYVVKAPQL